MKNQLLMLLLYFLSEIFNMTIVASPSIYIFFLSLERGDIGNYAIS